MTGLALNLILPISLILSQQNSLPNPTVIRLPEYKTIELPASALAPELGEQLWRKYGQYIKVDFPSPKTRHKWQLTNQGYVGYIPLTKSHHFQLKAKVPLQNLFGMLEYAFDLKSFHFLQGEMTCQSLPEFYERLAVKLAEEILTRVRRGLYQAYLPQTANLHYVRGRVDMRQMNRQLTPLPLPCHYDEQTADLPDNQILLWTLHTILRQRVTDHDTIERAYRALHGTISLIGYTAEDCSHRNYNRLNEDYQPLHALCRFFLAFSGPHMAAGEHPMWPFLVNMSQLYERFVAAWLEKQVIYPLNLKRQERVNLYKTHFEIDLVLSHRQTGQTLAVLDTKYKEKITNEDIFQITTYAKVKQAHHAILIYPQTMDLPQQPIGQDVQIHYLAFDLNDSIETSGARLWQQIKIIVRQI